MHATARRPASALTANETAHLESSDVPSHWWRKRELSYTIATDFTSPHRVSTASHLASVGVDVVRVNKVAEGRPHIVDAMKNGEVQLVFNTTEGAQSYRDSYSIRRTALAQNIAYYTTVSGARAAVMAISHLRAGELGVRALQAYA